MEVGIVDREKLVNIADAVRKKTGITGGMTLDAIASNITSMPTADNNAKFDFSGSGSKSSGDLLSYLTSVDLTGFDTSNYTDMSNMFYNYTSLTSIDLSNFNTSKVDNMSGMFQDCSSLKSLDLSSFDTSNIYNMNYMFGGCSSLTKLDVSNFKTSMVTGMYGMFRDCSSLKSLDLSSFDTNNVTAMAYMFYNCNSLTSLDLSSFDTSNVDDMNNMFGSMFGSMFPNSYKLSKLTLGKEWASNSSISSFDLSYCPLTHDSAVDVIEKLATRSNSPVIKFSSRTDLYQSEIDIATNKGWSVSGCTVL